MSDITTLNTSYIDNSSCFRYILGDDNVCARIIITGLTYNIKELCLVFNLLLNEKDIEDINKHKRCYIDFKSGKMTDKQLEHIRESSNGLQKALINKLYEKTEIKKEGKDYDRFNDFSKKLGVKIIIYDINKIIQFETEEEGYVINVLKNNDHYFVISNIDRFKPNSNNIYAGKKKKTPSTNIPLSNSNNIMKTYEEQIEILKRLKSKPFGDDVVKELVTSVSLDVFLDYKDSDFNRNMIQEWEYAISCNNCNVGDCFKCDGYRNFKSNVKLYTKRHICCKSRGTQLVSKCNKCNMYKFSGFKHICRDNRVAKRYTFLDEKYSIFINERVGQTSDHTTN